MKVSTIVLKCKSLNGCHQNTSYQYMQCVTGEVVGVRGGMKWGGSNGDDTKIGQESNGVQKTKVGMSGEEINRKENIGTERNVEGRNGIERNGKERNGNKENSGVERDGLERDNDEQNGKEKHRKERNAKERYGEETNIKIQKYYHSHLNIILWLKDKHFC